MVEQRYLSSGRCSTVRPLSLTWPPDMVSAAKRSTDGLLYANEGMGALANRTSRPDRCPHQITAEIEASIVAMRKAHPGWGPRTILSKLKRELTKAPSRSAIYRCLVRHGLINPKTRKRRREDYKRWERSRSMELWQHPMTVKANEAEGAMN